MLHHDAMRTTVDLPDSLLKQARRRADSAGTTLSSIVTEALRGFLSSAREPEARYEVKTFGRPGGRFPSDAEIRDALDDEDARAMRLTPPPVGKK